MGPDGEEKKKEKGEKEQTKIKRKWNHPFFQGSTYGEVNADSYERGDSQFRGDVPDDSQFRDDVPDDSQFRGDVPDDSQFRGDVPIDSHFRDPRDSHFRCKVQREYYHFHCENPGEVPRDSNFPIDSNWRIKRIFGRGVQKIFNKQIKLFRIIIDIYN